MVAPQGAANWRREISLLILTIIIYCGNIKIRKITSKFMRLLNKTIYLVAKQLRQWGYNFNEANDEQVQAMKREIQHLDGKIEFKIEQYPDGSWTAESVNLDGIITGGADTKEITTTIKDAVFTYFGIPPYLCNDTALRTDNEPVTLRQRVYV